MKKTILGFIACMAICSLAMAEQEWLTDAAKAQEQAKKENKLVLLDFTGSDWCGWCKKLDKEVFSKPDFQEYAKKNLVLVTVDFPRQTKLSDEQKKANDALKDKYSIKGYPTLVVLNGAGEKVGELSYDSGCSEKQMKEFEASHKVPVAEPSIFIAAVDKLKAHVN